MKNFQNPKRKTSPLLLLDFSCWVSKTSGWKGTGKIVQMYCFPYIFTLLMPSVLFEISSLMYTR